MVSELLVLGVGLLLVDGAPQVRCNYFSSVFPQIQKLFDAFIRSQVGLIKNIIFCNLLRVNFEDYSGVYEFFDDLDLCSRFECKSKKFGEVFFIFGKIYWQLVFLVEKGKETYQ